MFNITQSYFVKSGASSNIQLKSLLFSLCVHTNCIRINRDIETETHIFFSLFFFFLFFFCCGLLQCLPQRAVIFNVVCTICACVGLQSIFKRCVGCVFALHVAVFVGEYWVTYTVWDFFCLFPERSAALHGAALSVVFCAVVSVCLCVRLLLSATCWVSSKDLFFSSTIFIECRSSARFGISLQATVLKQCHCKC